MDPWLLEIVFNADEPDEYVNGTGHLARECAQKPERFGKFFSGKSTADIIFKVLAHAADIFSKSQMLDSVME